MKLKYYLRGLGVGIICTAVIMGIATSGKSKERLTDAEIIERARLLGMVMAEEAKDEEPKDAAKKEESKAEEPKTEKPKTEKSKDEKPKDTVKKGRTKGKRTESRRTGSTGN